MNNEIQTFYRLRAETTIAALQKNGFTAEYLPSKQDAVDRLLELIDEKAIVGCGGSFTLRQLGMVDLLNQRGNQVVHHNHPDLPPEQVLELRRQELTTDVFLTSTNALTLDGELVNIDGIGNRVAAMAFGPKQVVVVAGINKLTTDLEAAYDRVQNVAAPINAIRFSRNTPCTKEGRCMDCDSPERICRVTVVLERQPSQTPTTILIVGENLGY